MNARRTQRIVRVPAGEYRRLKLVDKRYQELLIYVRHLEGVRKARRDVRAGRVVPQERLFRSLGI